MLIVAIITGIIGLILTILWVVSWVKAGDVFDSNPWLFWSGAVFNCLWFIIFLFSLNLQLSTQNLTGYIYSSEDRLGYTTAHIRFSEQAGTDSQPYFCVKTESKAGNDIHTYAGSGKKVKVTVPPYFYLANNPFACGTTKMHIEEANTKPNNAVKPPIKEEETI